MKRIVSDKAPAALGPYVQAVDTGSTVYCTEGRKQFTRPA